MTGRYRGLAAGNAWLDWSHRSCLADNPGACVLCGRPALMRHPITGRPCHKTCDDRRAAREAKATERRLTR